MHILADKKIGYFTYYLIMAVIIECVTFLFLGIGLLPTYFIYDLSVILIISSVIFIIPNYLAQFITCMVLLVVQAVLSYVNCTLYNLYGDIFSFDMFRLAGEAAKAVTSDFASFWTLIFYVAVMVVIFLIGFYLYKRNRHNKIPFRKNFSLVFVIILLIFQCVGVGTYMLEKKDFLASSTLQDEKYVLSDRFLIDTNILKAKSFKKFGTFGYYSNSLAVFLSGADSAEKQFYEQADAYFDQGNIYNTSDVFGESTDNNLIVILLESIEWYHFTDGSFGSWHFEDENGNSKAISDMFDINSDLTPNMNALINESFLATNYFSKNKTNISEGVAIMGSHPVGKLLSQVTAGHNSDEDYMSFTMPNILNDKGYTTSFFHFYDEAFYRRNVTHGKLGFDNTYFINDYYSSSYTFGNWKKEADVLENAIDDFVPSATEKFYTFYSTLSTHGPYTDNSKNAEQVAHRQQVLDSVWYANLMQDYPELTTAQITHLVNCQASIVGLDNAIGVLVSKLKETPGLYEKTDILLFADHNNYYHNNTYAIKKVDVSEFENFDVNRVPFIYKSSNLTEKLDSLGFEKYTNRFCSSYDIVPTILDLMGIEFNENLYVGNSLFKTLDTVADGVEVVAFFSHTGGIFSDKMWTEDILNFNILDETVSEDYKNKFKLVARNLITQISYVNTLYEHSYIDSRLIGE